MSAATTTTAAPASPQAGRPIALHPVFNAGAHQAAWWACVVSLALLAHAAGGGRGPEVSGTIAREADARVAGGA